MKRKILLASLILLVASACPGQEGEPDDDAMIKDSGNPITSVLNLPVQDNVSFGIGEYERTAHLIKIQPIRLTVRTGRVYRIRSRSIIPFAYIPDVNSPTGGTFGLGDIVLTGYFSPHRLGKHIWGIGPVLSLPTATDEKLGSGKWSAGASAVLLTQRKHWLTGFILLNIWSFAGADDRPEVNRMQIDPLVRYHLGKRWMFVSSPTISADWTAPEGERWLVPVGGGIGRIWLMAGYGWSFEVQAFYNVIHPDTYPFPDWSMRFQVQFIGIRRKQGG
jgi:hypothetical protein